ncbi:TonB-dependent receptor [Acidicapsa acidisoli]|uniref:TonB-dependent receptor n=1 Tax=Acidicapsa acidisoli TaxID=1615681 RepID=UPI0021E0B613|nr:carboxypeptidase regulatory-like domain-containing protein [Acidicapsa acidisoli]
MNTGNLSGQITDSSGAVVRGVTLALEGKETGYKRTVQSEADGNYVFPNLPIGDYTLTVSASGFATEKEDETISVGSRTRADFHLHPGAADQTVEVTSDASGLSKDDASISTVVTNETIAETPLFLRNWDDLLRTVPGVQINRYTNQSGATNAGRTGDFNVNGVHSLQNNFILDGIDNNTFSENVQELSSEAAHPSVDVIAEFNVITNPYSAEYGRAPGAVVSVNTRSGSNAFHGTAYEYVRNQFFDSFDYFSKQTLAKKAEDNQNQFGGSFGGPIKRDRLFFFFNYEDTRVKQGVSRVSTVPLDNERIGDFSAAAAAVDGIAPYPTIYNPTTCSTPYNLKSSGCTPYVSNQIPSSQIDSTVSKLMALFPEPNFKNGSANYPELNNYSRTGDLTDFNGSYDARVDWTPTSADTVFTRFNYFSRNRDIPGYFGGLADGSSTSAWGNQILQGASVVLGWTRVISPRMVNDFRFGWVRDYSKAVQQSFGQSQTAGDFLPGVPNNPAIGGGVPLTSFTNFTFIGSPDFLPKQQIPMLYQYNDTLSWSLGNHNLKFGATVFAPMRNIFQDEPGVRGDLGFTGVFTGLSYADGLIGATQSTQLTNVFFVDQRLWMASGFAEDDWKVTPRLTLNLGLRYDFSTPATDAQNRMANFDPAGSGSLVFAKSGSLGDRALVNPQTTNFAPRIGVSYSLNDKTVLHGGYGIYYTSLERIGSEDQLALNPPNLINKTLASNTAPVIKPSVGFPSNFLDPSTINLNALQNFHVRAADPNAASPMVQQWSVGVQRQFTPVWLAELDYVGTKSTNLDVLRNYNQVEISGNQVVTSASAPGGTVPYPDFGQIEYLDPAGHGNYNGLQASLTRVMHNGLSVRAAYTYSHDLDNSPEELETNSGDAPNGRDYGMWYGNSDFDVRHRISANYVYELPFGHGKPMLQTGPAAWLLGNWRTSGVYTFYSGHPFTANWGSESTLLDAYGYATAVPNIVAPVHYLKTQQCWFYDTANKSCAAAGSGLTTPFADPGNYNIGDGRRNTLVGPGTQLFDFALIKAIPINERLNGEFRWEVFNAANHPIFGQPSGNASSSSVAQITTLSADPRVMQFAARINW